MKLLSSSRTLTGSLDGLLNVATRKILSSTGPVETAASDGWGARCDSGPGRPFLGARSARSHKSEKRLKRVCSVVKRKRMP